MDDIIKIENFNLDELLEVEARKGVAETASEIKEINLQQVADILEISKHTITENRAGMLINILHHPIIGKAITIQAFGGDSALLIKHPL